MFLIIKKSVKGETAQDIAIQRKNEEFIKMFKKANNNPLWFTQKVEFFPPVFLIPRIDI